MIFSRMSIAFFRDAGNAVFNPNLGVGGGVGKNTRVKYPALIIKLLRLLYKTRESENKIPHTTGFIITQMQ